MKNHLSPGQRVPAAAGGGGQGGGSCWCHRPCHRPPGPAGNRLLPPRGVGAPAPQGMGGTGERGKKKHPRNSGRTPRGKRKIIIKNNKEYFAFLEHAEFNPIYNSGVELG